MFVNGFISNDSVFVVYFTNNNVFTQFNSLMLKHGRCFDLVVTSNIFIK